ncbi:transcriptional regulator, DeoR family [Sediminispirochaeta smaragdinae DSM 11293]|jgi:DeoR/GlpR family transcriptional regulator of sugar metabolism|uniref:Transcriptional regulator, DeoR family n=2 Tax=Sediminispirochaeta TaxID=1911556 RepID=E1RAH6_SEDSS|nr:transcriptional regulator, DeoR family [Sediminispirochaeta smaragdinae DSM 11293]
MSESSIVANRHLKLLDILNRKGFVRVDQLSMHLNVSQGTIRRDLEYLSQKGLLERRHGGARIASSPLNSLPERDFMEKGLINTEEKKAIAKKALELVHDNDIIFLNSGSTTLHFLEALRDARVRVFTNNAWAVSCKKGPELELMILGGEYREQSRSFIGIMTLEAIKNINSNITFLGTNGISLEKGLTTAVHQECSINQAMIENTNGKVVVLADHSKIGRVSNFVSTALNEIDILITDKSAPSETLEKFKHMGVDVIIA